MSLLSAAVASNSTSQSINSGSLVFNPVLTLESPEAAIRSEPKVDTSTRFSDTSSTGTARARATIATEGSTAVEQGEDERLAPGIALGSSRVAGSLLGDMVPRGLTAGLSDPATVLIVAGLGLAAFFLAKRFL